MNTVIYEVDTGRIVQCLSGFTVEETETVLTDGQGAAEVDSLVNYRNHYILEGKAVERPTLDAILEGSHILGVPPGAQVHIEDDTYEADGSDIELAFEYPGTYTIRVECWPYLTWETTIENPA